MQPVAGYRTGTGVALVPQYRRISEMPSERFSMIKHSLCRRMRNFDNSIVPVDAVLRNAVLFEELFLKGKKLSFADETVVQHNASDSHTRNVAGYSIAERILVCVNDLHIYRGSRNFDLCRWLDCPSGTLLIPPSGFAFRGAESAI